MKRALYQRGSERHCSAIQCRSKCHCLLLDRIHSCPGALLALIVYIWTCVGEMLPSERAVLITSAPLTLPPSGVNDDECGCTVGNTSHYQEACTEKPEDGPTSSKVNFPDKARLRVTGSGTSMLMTGFSEGRSASGSKSRDQQRQRSFQVRPVTSTFNCSTVCKPDLIVLT